MLIKLLTFSVTSVLHQRRKGKAEMATAKGSTGNPALSQNEARLTYLSRQMSPRSSQICGGALPALGALGAVLGAWKNLTMIHLISSEPLENVCKARPFVN